MPDLWMDVDAALAEVPVNIFPLLDDTDFKTIEGAVAYNAAGMALRWHFTTAAGAYTVTSVTPTTSGNYDWTDQGDSGIYTIEIPASGGASINNDTEGFGWFTGVATGVLPWRGPVIGFRRAALNDLLFEGSTASTNLEDFFDGTGYVGGTAKLTVDATKLGGTTLTARDIGASVLLSSGTGTGQLDFTSGVVKANLAQILGTALTETSGLIAAAFKKFFNVATPTGTVNSLPDATPGAAGGVFIAGSNAATSVTTALTANITGNLSGSVGSVTGAVGSVTGAVGSVTGAVGSVTGAVGSVTGAVGSVAANGITATSIAADAINAAAVKSDAVTKIQNGLATPTNITAGTITTVTNLTNAPTSGDLTATMKASVNTEVDNALNTAIPGSPTADSVNERVATMDTSIALMRLLIATGTVVDDNDPDPTATAFETNLDEASNDHYNGAFCVFYSGALLGQSRKISDYDGTTKVITTSAFTEAPAGGDTFAILGRSE